MPGVGEEERRGGRGGSGLCWRAEILSRPVDWFFHLYMDKRFTCPEEVESAEFCENSAGSGVVIFKMFEGQF